MEKNRLEAFSDGVVAIIITIMVLEMKVPHGADWAALKPIVPVFLSYLLSFVYVAIYWNNHHHLLKACRHVNAGIMWANMLSRSKPRSSSQPIVHDGQRSTQAASLDGTPKSPGKDALGWGCVLHS
jgi:energy-coupling factor transporter transmembrane protein EcfT